MLKIYDVANWFLMKESMTHKKLQILCYYAYSWFIYANNDDIDNLKYKLFDDVFEAWGNGVVNINLYKKYKAYGHNKIKKTEKKIILLDVYNEFLEKIWKMYGETNEEKLEKLIKKEMPWKNAIKEFLFFGNGNNIISDEDMFKEYCFRQH